MKVLSLNFLTCAVKTCKTQSDSYPLHPKDAELVQDDVELNEDFLVNLLPRIDWTALSTTATEVRPVSDSPVLSLRLNYLCCVCEVACGMKPALGERGVR